LIAHLLHIFEDIEAPLRLVGTALFAFIFVRALTAAESHARQSAGGMLARVGLTAALILSLVAGLNYLVNPFGMYSPRLFEPIVLHSRTEKMRLYRAAQPAPEIVILGSSSSFTMPPAYISQRTGRPAFNASLHGGVPEDYLAFLRYIASIDKVPKVLIVPLSVELVRPNLPTGFEPHNPLRPYLDRTLFDPLAGLRWLFTLEQTRASFRLLAAEQSGRPPSHYRFDADGWAHFADTGASLDQIVDSYLATKEWGRGLYAFERLDETQMSYFRQFLALARRLHVKVIVYLPPLYPRAVALYERETNLLALRAQLMEHLRAWQGEGLVAAVHDFTRIESFGGQAAEFHDLAHPSADASRRMLDLLLGPPARS
jgi:hypothetical protein